MSRAQWQHGYKTGEADAYSFLEECNKRSKWHFSHMWKLWAWRHWWRYVFKHPISVKKSLTYLGIQVFGFCFEKW